MAGREYSTFRPTFWTGDTGRELRSKGQAAQLVAAYLITCSSANMIGLYYLPMPLLCHELGMKLEGACKALERVCETQFAAYDAPSEVVWIPEMAKQQIGETMTPKDNRHKAVIRLWSEMRKSLFYNDFYTKYGECFCLPKPCEMEAPSKPLERGRVRTRADQDQEQDQDKDKGGRLRSVSINGFVKPSLEEISAYCLERKNSVSPQKFFDYYESNGWRVGKNPMKCWQATVRTWEKNEFQNCAKQKPLLANEPDFETVN
jgi:hypothetical protein